MIEGLILMVIALALACASPAARQMDARQRGRALYGELLHQAYPLPPPAPSLDELTQLAESALEQDALARGVRGVRDTYDRA